MIKEDIPYLKLKYLLHSKVHTLHKIPIYHMKILTQHEMAPDMFEILLNIPLKNSFPFMKNDVLNSIPI